MSAFVVVQPRLTRTAPRASAGETPMAARTWEGCTLPDEQAAPDDTATPSRSKAMMAVSAFTPASANSVVFGSRSAPAPKITACGEMAHSPASSACRSASIWAASSASCRARRRRRGAECRDAGDILGAGARAALLAAAADERIGKVNVLAPAHQRADAFGAADLVRRERQQVGAERADIAGNAARRLHRIDMQEAAGRVHDRGGLGDRLHHAGLVVGQHDRDQRPRRLWQQLPPAPRDRSARRHRPGMSSIASRGNRPPARTEACSIAEINSRSRGRFSSAVSIAGVSASILASVPLEVKITSAGRAADQRRHLLARLLDQVPRRAALGMHRGRIAGQRQTPPRKAALAPAAASGAVAFQSR